MTTQNPSNSEGSGTALTKLTKQIVRAKDKFPFLVEKAGTNLNYEQEARFALQHIERQPQLLKCSPESVYNSFLNLATMGLSMNPAYQQVAFVPRWNTAKRGLECTASPMYRGLIHLAHNSGIVKQIQSDVVYTDDKFEVHLGTSPELDHWPASSNLNRGIDLINLDNNNLVAAYCVAWFKSTTVPHITVMWLEDILMVSNASEAFNPNAKRRKAGATPSGPWLTWPGQMAIKSAIRRATKQWPMMEATTPHFAEAVRIDSEGDVMEMRTHEEERTVIEGSSVQLISTGQAKNLRDLCRYQSLPVSHVYNNYKVNKMEELPSDKYEEVKTKLKARAQKVTEKNGVNTGQTVQS